MNVPRHRLLRARTELEAAVESTTDAVARDVIRETAAAIAELVAADRNPDPAVIEGHAETLRHVRDRVEGEAARRIDRALEYLESDLEERSTE